MRCRTQRRRVASAAHHRAGRSRCRGSRLARCSRWNCGSSRRPRRRAASRSSGGGAQQLPGHGPRSDCGSANSAQAGRPSMPGAVGGGGGSGASRWPPRSWSSGVTHLRRLRQLGANTRWRAGSAGRHLGRVRKRGIAQQLAHVADHAGLGSRTGVGTSRPFGPARSSRRWRHGSRRRRRWRRVWCSAWISASPLVSDTATRSAFSSIARQRAFVISSATSWNTVTPASGSTRRSASAPSRSRRCGCRSATAR